MPKLQAKISEALHDCIIQAKIDLDKSKGKVLQHFIKLAVQNPDAAKRDFGTSEDKSCTLEMSKSEWSEAQDYRSQHRLDKRVSFFRDALARGATVYLDAKEGVTTVAASESGPSPTENGADTSSPDMPTDE